MEKKCPVEEEEKEKEVDDQSKRTGKNNPVPLGSFHLMNNLCCQVVRTPLKNISTSKASEIPSTKIFRLRYAICEGCKEEFDVFFRSNSKGDCDCWHVMVGIFTMYCTI